MSMKAYLGNWENWIFSEHADEEINFVETSLESLLGYLW